MTVSGAVVVEQLEEAMEVMVMVMETRINVTAEIKPEAAAPAALGFVGADRANPAEGR